MNSRGKICSIIKESASRKFDIKEEVCPTYYAVSISIFSAVACQNHWLNSWWCLLDQVRNAQRWKWHFFRALKLWTRTSHTCWISYGIFYLLTIIVLWLWQVMLTLLTQLELGEVQYLHLLPQLNVTCTLNFYKVGCECNLIPIHFFLLLSVDFFMCLICLLGYDSWMIETIAAFQFGKACKPHVSAVL